MFKLTAWCIYSRVERNPYYTNPKGECCMDFFTKVNHCCIHQAVILTLHFELQEIFSSGLVFMKGLSQVLGLNSVLLCRIFKRKTFCEYGPWIFW